MVPKHQSSTQTYANHEILVEVTDFPNTHCRTESKPLQVGNGEEPWLQVILTPGQVGESQLTHPEWAHPAKKEGLWEGKSCDPEPSAPTSWASMLPTVK